jgi:hypothetical protein
LTFRGLETRPLGRPANSLWFFDVQYTQIKKKTFNTEAIDRNEINTCFRIPNFSLHSHF